MYPRLAQQPLADLLAQFPAVVLLGPRQAGKTTLALAESERHSGALYLDLELPSAQRQLDDAEAFLLAHRNRLVILDEVQRMPGLFAVLRGDRPASPGGRIRRAISVARLGLRRALAAGERKPR